MKRPKRLLYLIEAVIVIFIAWAIFGILSNSKSLKSATVTLSDGGVEYHDKTVLGVGKDDAAADYWLRAFTTEGVVDLGTYANTEIGKGLTFTPQQNVPLKEIVEFQLLDKDRFENDVLLEFPFDSNKHVGTNYTLEVQSSTSIEAGFAWFFKTPVGIAILTGLIIGIAVVVIGNCGIGF